MTFKNFYLINQSGRTIYSKNFAGEKLDQSFILVVASSVLNFSKTLLSEDVKELTTMNNRIFLKEVGEV
jgi:hypothetical protein